MATAAAPKITVHHLNNSRSSRILWLLEELELPYEMKEYKRDENMRAPKDLAKVHPLGKAPVVTVEEGGKTILLPESGAIVDWFITRHAPHLLPSHTDIEGTAKHLEYMHYAEGSLMGPLLQMLMFKIVPMKSPALMRPLVRPIFSGLISQEPALKRNFSYIEDELKKAGGEYFVGNKLTGADFMLWFPIVSYAPLPEFQKNYPTLHAWIKKIEERPAYKKAIEKGGNVDYSHILA